MAQDRLAQMCGISVCAIFVLGIDDPNWGMGLGMAMGAFAIYGVSLAGRLGQKPRRPETAPRRR